MSLMGVLYLAGMALVFTGERLLTAHEGARWGATGLGLLAVAAALGWAVRRLRETEGEGLRHGFRAAAILIGLGAGSLVLHALSGDLVTDGLGMGTEAVRRWRGVWGALWPIVWLLATIPLLLVDQALWRSPRLIPVQRVQALVASGLAAALGIALAFPVSYLAARHNHRWDLTYFKTASAGTATQNIVAALERPINVRIFLPPASDLADELRGYFDPLEGPTLTVEVVDQAAHPRLAKVLRVRDNGLISFTMGDVILPEEGAAPDPDTPSPVTKTLEVGKDLDAARRKLKKLDEEVQKVLLELGQADRVVYLTRGHGELGWEGKPERGRNLAGLRRFFQAMHFEVKTTSMADGLDTAVPEDADLLAIIGPRERFLAAEVDSIRTFVAGGGSVLLALEPEGERADATLAGSGEDALQAWVTELGIRPGVGILAAEGGYVPVWNAKRDRTNLVTNRFSVHPSSRVLAERASQVMLFHPGAGFWEPVDGASTRVTYTVRSLPISWADVNGNLELDADAGETKAERNVVAAITPADGSDSRWRVLALADASMLSDLALGNLGNQQFVHDGVNWLLGAEALSGTTESEEDVKIEHTKEDQTLWFYGTVLGVPLLVLLLGGLRLKGRGRRVRR